MCAYLPQDGESAAMIAERDPKPELTRAMNSDETTKTVSLAAGAAEQLLYHDVDPRCGIGRSAN